MATAPQPTTPTQEEVERFVAEAFRNLPTRSLSAMDVADIRRALASFARSRCHGGGTDPVREALRPFADKAAQFSAQPDGLVTIQMDFAHFRRASQVLSAPPSRSGQDVDGATAVIRAHAARLGVGSITITADAAPCGQSVSVEVERLAIDRAEAFAKSLHTTPEEHNDIMVAVRRARAALSAQGMDAATVVESDGS